MCTNMVWGEKVGKKKRKYNEQGLEGSDEDREISH